MASNNPDYILDIQGLQTPQANASDGASARKRPWIAIHWRCCHAYSRLYRNRDGTAYTGSCPKCFKPARANIGPDGTDQRFFYAQ